MWLVRVLAFVAGAAVVAATVSSAIRSFVLPRGVPILLNRWVFVLSRALFQIRSSRLTTFEERDRVLASYAPFTLIGLPAVWLTIVVLAYTPMYWALGADSWRVAFTESGSSLLTLGVVAPSGLPQSMLAFTEAAVGLGLVALLISFLPSMYGNFSRREAQVATMAVRAGSPPTPEELLRRAWQIDWMDRLPGLWESWQAWFIELEETHTSFPALVFFRSPQPDRSWVTAAGCLLDTAAIRSAAFDLPREPEAELCIRSGYLALRRIADYFAIQYDPDPPPNGPISVTRDELDVVIDRLAALGMPVREDRDQVWRDFQGWRVNYDIVLVTLAGFVMAPPAPWSSDRSIPYHRPPLLPRPGPRSRRRLRELRARRRGRRP